MELDLTIQKFETFETDAAQDEFLKAISATLVLYAPQSKGSGHILRCNDTALSSKSGPVTGHRSASVSLCSAWVSSASGHITRVFSVYCIGLAKQEYFRLFGGR